MEVVEWCFLCGHPGAKLTSLISQSLEKSLLFTSWNESVASSLLKILGLDESFSSIFTKAVYCDQCIEIIYGVEFLLKSIGRLENELTNLTHDVHSIIHAHYILRTQGTIEDSLSSSPPVDQMIRTLNTKIEDTNEFILPEVFSVSVEPPLSQLRQNQIKKKRNSTANTLYHNDSDGIHDDEAVADFNDRLNTEVENPTDGIAWSSDVELSCNYTQCAKKSIRFHSASDLIHHFKNIHGALGLKTPNHCSYCSFRHEKINHLKLHILKSHRSNSYSGNKRAHGMKRKNIGPTQRKTSHIRVTVKPIPTENTSNNENLKLKTIRSGRKVKPVKHVANKQYESDISDKDASGFQDDNFDYADDIQQRCSESDSAFESKRKKVKLEGLKVIVTSANLENSDEITEKSGSSKLTHEGFVCPHCSKLHNSMKNLKDHILRQRCKVLREYSEFTHEVSNCADCSKLFSTKKNLKELNAKRRCKNVIFIPIAEKNSCNDENTELKTTRSGRKVKPVKHIVTEQHESEISDNDASGFPDGNSDYADDIQHYSSDSDSDFESKPNCKTSRPPLKKVKSGRLKEVITTTVNLENSDKNSRNSESSKLRDERFKCSHCSWTFQSRRNLIEHLTNQRCKGLQTRPCTICKAVFESAEELDKHERLHATNTEEKDNCVMCSEEFNSTENLLRHVKDLHIFPKVQKLRKTKKREKKVRGLKPPTPIYNEPETIPLLCNEETCESVTFDSKESFLHHSLTNHNLNFYDCDSCNCVFQTGEMLQQHIHGHHDYMWKSKLKCKVCWKSFQNENTMKTHQEKHVKGSYECILCSHPAESNGKLIEHVQTEHDGRKLHCNFPSCLELAIAVRYDYQMINHLKDEHGLEGEDLKLIYHCTQCSVRFLASKHLAGHISMIHSTAGEFPCSICGKYFVSVEKVKRHEKDFHTSYQMSPKCNICNKSFPSLEEVTAHETLHSSDRPYDCILCDKVFRCTLDLHQHVKKKHEIYEFKCDVEGCDAAYETATKLKFHKSQIHPRPEKILHCNLCSYTCIAPSRLRYHSVCHTGEVMPCTVEGCDKTFKFRSRLNVHKRKDHGIGNEMNKIPCKVCGKTFPTQSHMRAHEAYHTDSRPFMCDICSFTSKSVRNLRTHMKVHDNPFRTTGNMSKPRAARIQQLSSAKVDDESSDEEETVQRTRIQRNRKVKNRESTMTVVPASVQHDAVILPPGYWWPS